MYINILQFIVEGYHNQQNTLSGINCPLWRLVNILIREENGFRPQLEMVDIGQTGRVVSRRQPMKEKATKRVFENFELVLL